MTGTSQDDPTPSARSGSPCSTTATTSRPTTPSCGATTTSPAAPGNDEIYGQLGNDVIQGDGAVTARPSTLRPQPDAVSRRRSRHARPDGRLPGVTARRQASAPVADELDQTSTGRSSSTRRSRRADRRRRLHRGQRRQRHDLRRPRPGRHRRRQLRPLPLWPRRRVRHDRRPARRLARQRVSADGTVLTLAGTGAQPPPARRSPSRRRAGSSPCRDDRGDRRAAITSRQRPYRDER